MTGLDDDVRAEERADNSDDSDDLFSSHKTIYENGYQQPVETVYVENAVEELGQVGMMVSHSCRGCFPG